MRVAGMKLSLSAEALAAGQRGVVYSCLQRMIRDVQRNNGCGKSRGWTEQHKIQCAQGWDDVHFPN